jgi:hypothetical protein
VPADFLATGIVILISIAIGAGIVFLLVLTGIIFALFARRGRREDKYVPSEYDADDDSAHERPTSLLAHINAATRNTILGAGSASPFSPSEKAALAGAGAAGAAERERHPYGPDADGFEEAPGSPVGMALGGDEDGGRPARARYSFDGAEDGELPLSAGGEVLILDDRDPA